MDEEQQMQEAVRQDQAPRTERIEVAATQIVIDRQSLLDVIRALDVGAKVADLPASMDRLREPFFLDEFSSGKARSDFSMNTYA
jgi:hypothetical protein